MWIGCSFGIYLSVNIFSVFFCISVHRGGISVKLGTNIHHVIGLDEQGLTSDLTHFRSFRRRWGDCSISQDCSRSQRPQCVRCWVVCARPLLITVVCKCIIWKLWIVGISGTRLYLCIYNQPSWVMLKRYPPPG